MNELLSLFLSIIPQQNTSFPFHACGNTQKEFFELEDFFLKFHVMLNPQFHLYLFMYLEPIKPNHRAYLRWTNWINGPAREYANIAGTCYIFELLLRIFFNTSIKMSLSVNFNTILWVFSHAAHKTIICSIKATSWGVMGMCVMKKWSKKKGKN